MGRLLAAALLLAGLAACGEGMPLAYPYCSSLLEPRAQRYCLAYINSATSNGKWLTATAWSKFRRSSCECSREEACARPCRACLARLRRPTSSCASEPHYACLHAC